MSKKLQLSDFKVGQYWIRRDNKVVRVKKVGSSMFQYPIKAGKNHYTERGFVCSDDCKNPKDLIKQVYIVDTPPVLED